MVFLTPTSQPNDMLAAYTRQVLSGWASNTVTVDTEIRVMASHCLPCTQGWKCILCAVLCWGPLEPFLPVCTGTA